MQMPAGRYILAAVAAPPSPLKPAVPLPANVLMIPDVLITRIHWLNWSVTYTLPLPSTATPQGLCTWHW